MKVLVMCLADPSGNPRPRRIIEVLHSMKAAVDVVSYPLKKDLGGINRLYEMSLPKKMFLMRVFRLLTRLFVWLLPFDVIKYWANNYYFGASKIDVELGDCSYDLLIVEDLQLLPLAFKVKGEARVIFDAREYYPKQNEESLIFQLLEKPQRVRLCRKYLPQCDVVLTVSPSLAAEYEKEFHVKTMLLRSTPHYYDCEVSSVNKNTINLVHHGAANKNRHLEKMIDVFSKLEKRFKLDFYLVGDGEYINKLKKLAAPYDGIRFMEPLLFDDILPSLNKYDIGFFYVEPSTFNLKYCLPNKFFEFIQARLMVAIGPSPDMAGLVNHYKCGLVSKVFDSCMMARDLNELTADDIMKFKQASDLAAKELCFEKESKQLKKTILLLSTVT